MTAKKIFIPSRISSVISSASIFDYESGKGANPLSAYSYVAFTRAIRREIAGFLPVQKVLCPYKLLT